MKKRTNVPCHYVDIYNAFFAYAQERGVDFHMVAEKMERQKGRVCNLISSRTNATMVSYRNLAAALNCELKIVMFNPNTKEFYAGLSQFLKKLDHTEENSEKLKRALSLVASIAEDPDEWKESGPLTTRKLHMLGHEIGCIPVFELHCKETGCVYKATEEEILENERRLQEYLVAEEVL